MGIKNSQNKQLIMKQLCPLSQVGIPIQYETPKEQAISMSQQSTFQDEESFPKPSFFSLHKRMTKPHFPSSCFTCSTYCRSYTIHKPHVHGFCMWLMYISPSLLHASFQVKALAVFDSHSLGFQECTRSF
jgi:hypothetical protein